MPNNDGLPNGNSLDELVGGLLATGAPSGGTSPPSGNTPTPGEGGGADDGEIWDLTEGDEPTSQQPDEPATDPADADSGEGEDDPHEPNTEPFYTVTVDGKQERVALSEALAGYQRQRDYTVKTQQVADMRKQAETEIGAIRQARTQYDSLLQGLQAQINGVKEPTAEQWEQLKAADPDKYVVEYTDYQRRENARNALKAERDRVAAEQQADLANKFREIANAERGKLIEHMPTWKDPEKYKTGAKAVFDFVGKQYGFSDQEVAQTIDHRIVRMAEDARRYHALLARRAQGKAKVDAAPIVQPRGRVPTPSRKAVADQDAMKRFQRSGKIDDAISLIMSR